MAINSTGRQAREAAACRHVFRSDHDWVYLAATMDGLTLASRKPSEEMTAYMRAVLEKAEGEPPYHAHERFYAQRTLHQLEAPDEVAVPLQVLRIGPVGIAAIPFEVFVEIGLALKERSPLSQSFTISLANGAYAYLPTPRHHELGGYETWLGTSLVEPEASTKIVDRLLDLLAELNKR